MNYRICIQNGDIIYIPSIEGCLTWETARKGQPGKLTCTLLSDDKLRITEGNSIWLQTAEGKQIFYGYLFELAMRNDNTIKVTAYDQLRYLKNKDRYVYTNKTATEVVQMIADDFMLSVGTLDDTGHRIPSRVEDDTSLFDMILNAIDLTNLATGRLFVLYDDCGKLMLRDIDNLKLDTLITNTTAEDYDYKSSIDTDTYNQIKMYYENEETGKRELYITKSSESINTWGLLQLYEKLEKNQNGQATVDSKLAQHNKKSKELSIKHAFGDLRVRAGCMLPVQLTLYDKTINHFLLVETVKHSFEEGIHTMDLELRGNILDG